MAPFPSTLQSPFSHLHKQSTCYPARPPSAATTLRTRLSYLTHVQLPSRFRNTIRHITISNVPIHPPAPPHPLQPKREKTKKRDLPSKPYPTSVTLNPHKLITQPSIPLLEHSTRFPCVSASFQYPPYLFLPCPSKRLRDVCQDSAAGKSRSLLRGSVMDDNEE